MGGEQLRGFSEEMREISNFTYILYYYYYYYFLLFPFFITSLFPLSLSLFCFNFLFSRKKKAAIVQIKNNNNKFKCIHSNAHCVSISSSPRVRFQHTRRRNAARPSPRTRFGRVKQVGRVCYSLESCIFIFLIF